MAARSSFSLLWCIFAILLVASVSSEEEDAETEATESEEVTETDSVGEEALQPEEENGVVVLTTDNFDAFVNDKPIVLVEFYAPWCGHCKTLAPEYEKAAAQLKAADPPVLLAKVDATVESDLGKRFEVQGYPTLKMFRNGVASDYDGPRQEQGIVDYMKEQSDPNWQPPKEEVIVLTKDNFTEITTREELMLVEFYTPWCGHCKRLAPTYEKAAHLLKGIEKPILLAKVDCTTEKELATENGVTSYPTLKMFRKGKAYEYKGETNNENAMASYMEDQAGPSSKYIASLKETKNFATSSREDIVILGLFDGESDPMLQTYYDANNDLRSDYQFGHTFNADAKAMFKVKGSAVVVIHPRHLVSKHETAYPALTNADASVANLVQFYEDNKAPLVGHYQSSTEKRFSKRPLLLVFYDVNFSHEYLSLTQFWRNKVVAIAKDYPDIQFAVADEESSADKLKELGLTESGEDVNVGLYDKDAKKYAMTEEFSDEAVRDFLDSFNNGELKPILKSQVKPKKNDGPVKVVVGNTFEEIVMDKSKDVMVEIYAPWCGHCKSLEPIYKKLGKKYADEKTLVIAKMDGTTNDVPSAFKTEGYPTIYWSPAGKKDAPVKYENARTLKDLSKFIDDNLTSGKKDKDEL